MSQNTLSLVVVSFPVAVEFLRSALVKHNSRLFRFIIRLCLIKIANRRGIIIRWIHRYEIALSLPMFPTLHYALYSFIFFEFILECLDNIGMKSLEVSIHFFHGEFLNRFCIISALEVEGLKVKFHEIVIFRFLLFIKLDVMLDNMSLAKFLRNLILKTVEKLGRNIHMRLRDEANKDHKSFVELSLTTHNVKNLLHVLFKLLKTLRKLGLRLS